MINLIDGDSCAQFGLFRRLVIQREQFEDVSCVTARAELGDGTLGGPWVVQEPASIEFRSTDPLYHESYQYETEV